MSVNDADLAALLCFSTMNGSASPRLLMYTLSLTCRLCLRLANPFSTDHCNNPLPSPRRYGRSHSTTCTSHPGALFLILQQSPHHRRAHHPWPTHLFARLAMFQDHRKSQDFRIHITACLALSPSRTVTGTVKC